ncbi:phenylacetate--CoA ligase family protein [Geodermatophilus sp. SYSU D00708]
MQPTPTSPATRLREDLQRELLTGYDELIPRTSWGRDRIRDHQRTRLRALLHHTVRRSPFHADRLAGVDIDRLDPDDLSALPVMSKCDLMEHFDDAVTDPAVTRERVEAALARAEDAVAALPGSVLAMTSGGSSGPRGVFVQDLPASRQFFGALSRGLVARLRADGAPPGGLRIAMVGARSPVHATGAACWLTAGGELPFHLLSVPVTQPLADVVDQLTALRPDALYGYPTVLARLAQEQRSGRLRIAPSVVTCTSETLTPELRATIRAGFGVPVADTFGSTEGLVGTSAPDDDVLVFAEDGCIVELVDERDRPVPPGTPSAAVLVTTLENRLQPLIRYRLADSFTELPPVPGPGHLRARVQGRSDDVLAFGGVPLHPLVVRSVLVHRPEVVDHRVRQTCRGIVVEALTCNAADHPALRAALRADLTAALTRAGLPDAEVTVCTVADLPRDPRTGKVRRVVPLV